MAAYTMAHFGNAANCWSKAYKWNADHGGAQIVLKKAHVNFTGLAAAASSATFAASDTYQVIPISPNETVLACGFNIATAMTASCDLDLGLTAGDVDGFIDGIEADDTTPTVVAAPFGLLSGTRFASADTLDLLALTAAPSGDIDVWALILRIG